MSRELLKIRPLGGLREGARGERGEAAEMVNFTVTGQGLLTLRPGVRALELPFGFDTRGQVIRGLWAGFLGRGEFLAVATSPAGEYGANGDYIQVFRRKEEGFAAAALLPRPFGAKTAWVQFSPSAESSTPCRTRGICGFLTGAFPPWIPPASGLRRWRPMSPWW